MAPVKLTEKSLEVFLDELSSSLPAPGGGSVAALSGALGVALVSMVGNLTIGKKKYANVQDDMAKLIKQSEKFRSQLITLIDEDVQAFTHVSEAMKMPRDTEDEKTIRSERLEEALKAATKVPMDVAEVCVAVMKLCQTAAEKGNINVISDAGVAVLMAEAGLRSAALNVFINLGWIKDHAFVNATRLQLDRILEGTASLRDEVYGFVVSTLLKNTN